MNDPATFRTNAHQHLRTSRFQLAEMEICGRCRAMGGIGPRSGIALALATLGWAGTGGVAYLARKAGMTLPFSPAVGGLIVAFIVLCLVSRYSSAPRTYTAKMNALMDAYQPVNADAYLTVLKAKERHGFVENHVLYDWIYRERQAIAEAMKLRAAQNLAESVIERARRP